jgi:DNA-binding beta-propeller fold protein YncE
MRLMPPKKLFLVCLLVACSGGNSWGDSVDLPDGGGGIGFDDLRYSVSLKRVLVPGGRTGNLVLIDPDSKETTVISGFSKQPGYDGGHDFGATSVDEGGGFLFVMDRTSNTVDVVDPNAKSIVLTAPLSGGGDYVRWVAATSEVWISDPGASHIEIFSFTASPPSLKSLALLEVAGGPESLVIDARRGLAYTHLWLGRTVVIDVHTRAVVANWPNGCAASRGIALDEERAFLLVGCNEGTTVVMDTAHDGKVLSVMAKGSGYDVIGYNPALAHVYLAGDSCGCMVTLGVSAEGQLSFLGRVEAPSGAKTHCVTADDRGHSWACDQDSGRVWRIPDDAPASGH